MADTKEMRCQNCKKRVEGWRRIGPNQYVHTEHPATCVTSEERVYD